MTTLYLAGPMRGIPHFNFPAFMAAASDLRGQGYRVFNPAERDNKVHGTDISAGNYTGDENQAMYEHGFSLRLALSADLQFICEEADGICMLPGWEALRGARAELAAAEALGMPALWWTALVSGYEHRCRASARTMQLWGITFHASARISVLLSPSECRGGSCGQVHRLNGLVVSAVEHAARCVPS